MKKLKCALLEGRPNIVYYEETCNHEAPISFDITTKMNFEQESTRDMEITLTNLKFHSGSTTDGLNGITNEDLLAIVITRLDHFQDSKLSCPENVMALEHLNKAFLLLADRVENRKDRGVYGTKER